MTFEEQKAYFRILADTSHSVWTTLYVALDAGGGMREVFWKDLERAVEKLGENIKIEDLRYSAYVNAERELLDSESEHA